MNTVPSRLIRGLTVRITPVSRYCTYLKVPVPPPSGLKLVVVTGIFWPTLSSASTLLRTISEGVDKTRMSETVSSAVIVAALGPEEAPAQAAVLAVPAMCPRYPVVRLGRAAGGVRDRVLEEPGDAVLSAPCR